MDQEVEIIPIKLNDQIQFSNKTESFFRGERLLESIGFFSLSKKGSKSHNVKKVPFKAILGGKDIDGQIEILASGDFGLPSTPDLDKYHAFQKLLSDAFCSYGGIPQPFAFSSADLLTAMGSQNRKGGTFYKEVITFLDRMSYTGIKGYFGNQTKFMSITDPVPKPFKKVISVGGMLDDGSMADRHFVWLADWYIQFFSLLFHISDYNDYLKLFSPLAKALYDPLNIGFSTTNGKYKKLYPDLCVLIGMQEYQHKSRIKQQFDQAHKELKGIGLLKEYLLKINRQGVHSFYWYAGDKFFENQKRLQIDPKLKSLFWGTATKEQLTPGNDDIHELVLYFQKKKNGKDGSYKPTSSEITKAKSLLTSYGKDKAYFIVDFAISKMRETNFKPLYFGAVNNYIGDALTQLRQEQKKGEELKKKKEAEARQQLEEYKEWLEQTPDERIQGRLEFWQSQIRNFEHREPSEEEIEAKRGELIEVEPTPKEKQLELFGRVIDNNF